jgi:hypothetical protein
MQKQYAHPLTGKAISFREPTTSESISATAYKFAELARPNILDLQGLQIGKIVRTSEGVYVNAPKQALNGNQVDEQMLKSFLNGVKPCKVGNGNIYLVPNSETLRNFGFAEYASFSQGVQDCNTFAESGLAKVLEHAEKAQNLSAIADVENYSQGVNVFDFSAVSSPVVKVAGLLSGEFVRRSWLLVSGYGLSSSRCHAFGVLD